MQERILEEMQTICENVNRDIDAGIVEHDFYKHTGFEIVRKFLNARF
jgi:hypothetical protein